MLAIVIAPLRALSYTGAVFRNSKLNNKEIINMSMRLSWWPASLQERIRETFQYDDETGEVTRKLQPIKGPKTYGPVGTLLNGRDLVVVLHHEGKSWTCRVAKIALFLHTGKQYKFIEFVDGNRTNTKISNLITRGEEVTEENSSQEALRLMREKAVASMKLKRTQTYVDFVKKEAIEAENKVASLEKERKEKEPEIDWYARGQEAIREEQEKRFAFVQGPLKPFLALRDKYEKLLEKYRYKRGLCTRMSAGDLAMFEDDCARQGIANLVAFYNERKLDFEPANHEKWMVDAFNLGKWRHMESSGYAIVKPKIDGYMWEGEEVHHVYDELSEEDTVAYQRELAALEQSLGTTEQQLEEAFLASKEKQIEEIVEKGAILSQVQREEQAAS
jgi:hypothetical protein